MGFRYSAIPSFVAIKSETTNVRRGNGTDYRGIHHHEGSNLLEHHHAVGRVYFVRDDHHAAGAKEHLLFGHHAFFREDRYLSRYLDSSGAPEIGRGAPYPLLPKVTQ